MGAGEWKRPIDMGGMEDVEPPDDISTTSTPSTGALGAYTISGKEK